MPRARGVHNPFPYTQYENGMWDSGASIMSPTRKPYWIRDVYIGRLTPKRRQQQLDKYARRWKHEVIA